MNDEELDALLESTDYDNRSLPLGGWYRGPTVLTRRGRQLEMQNWLCCFCGGRHAWWFHDHPGRDSDGAPVTAGESR